LNEYFGGFLQANKEAGPIRAKARRGSTGSSDVYPRL